MSGQGKVWKRAYQLKVGDRIKSNGHDIAVKSIDWEVKESPVYNLEVAGTENFLVNVGKQYLVVHNGGDGK